jgi:hypothetical protein
MMRQAGLSLRVRQCCHNCLAVESPYIDKPLGDDCGLVVFCMGKASAKLHKKQPHAEATESVGDFEM